MTAVEDLSPVAWHDGAVLILDQTRLPFEEVTLTCTTLEAVGEAITRLAVRGAPVLGITAAYGMALAAFASTATDGRKLHRDLRVAGRFLTATRPTAVNIAWAVDRVSQEIDRMDDPAAIRARVLETARRIERQDREACEAIGRHGADLVTARARILTHCNTGHLCTAGIGTAQGVIETAHRRDRGIQVWVDETRPVLQGARLTAYELRRLGIPMTLVADSAAASLMARGMVDLVITGADRIAGNGDTANKIGTYGLAVLAKHHHIPFVVAAPFSTVDPGTRSGAGIDIEERDPAEVLRPRGVPFAAEGTPAANPAFDVTPGRLITAIVTERGVARPPFRQSLARLGREGGER